jgi:hypothetical protein
VLGQVAASGLALLALVLFIEIMSAHKGWSPGAAILAFAVGAPCGMLLFFARTGRRSWFSALVVPVLTIVQSVSISLAVTAFPHSNNAPIAASITVPWFLIIAVYLARRTSTQSLVA